jgi:hypothetical protein
LTERNTVEMRFYLYQNVMLFILWNAVEKDPNY